MAPLSHCRSLANGDARTQLAYHFEISAYAGIAAHRSELSILGQTHRTNQANADNKIYGPDVVRSALPSQAARIGFGVKVLGAILAGGQAHRFGSDKAHASYQGRRLIDLVCGALRVQTTALIVCGREEPGFDCVPDIPAAGMGPLGGLNAGLACAQARGFSHLLTCGVDVPNLPPDLAAQLRGEGAAIVASQPVVGLWPVSLLGDLVDYLDEGGRALYGFAEQISARRIDLGEPLLNVNHPDDLR